MNTEIKNIDKEIENKTEIDKENDLIDEVIEKLDELKLIN